MTHKREKLTLDEINTWAAPHEDALLDEMKGDYNRKRSALTQYAQGATEKDYYSSTGVNRVYIQYLIRRCRKIEVDQLPAGLFGLLKYRHLDKPRLNDLSKLHAAKPLSGSLQALFSKFPELKNEMEVLATEGKSPDLRFKIAHNNRADRHATFLRRCEFHKVRPPSFPYNSEDFGRKAFTLWCDKTNARALHNKAAEAANKKATRLVAPIFEEGFYTTAQADGHSVDCNFELIVPSLHGEGPSVLKVDRLWWFPIQIESGGSIIGYSVCYESNYDSGALTRAARSCLVPWKPRELSVTTIEYKKDECLPNALDERLSYLCFDFLRLDNALSHLASLVASSLGNTVSPTLVFGRIHNPDGRPNIEGLFGLFEEAGIHRLDGSLGSGPTDPERNQGKDRYRLSADLLLDLIDLLAVRWNSMKIPGGTIGRNESLMLSVKTQNHLLRYIPTDKRESTLAYDLTETAKVSKSKKGRLHVWWHQARYYGAALLKFPQLNGKEIVLQAHSMDVTTVLASVKGTGEMLGLLKVEPRWSTPHSLNTRRKILKISKTWTFLSSCSDIVAAFRQELQKRAFEKPRLSKLLTQVVSEMNASATPLKATDDVPTEDSEKQSAGIIADLFTPASVSFLSWLKSRNADKAG